MALSEKQKQKKILKKKQKRSSSVSAVKSFANRITSVSCTSYPLNESLVPSNLFETGIGNVVISRKLPEGELAVSVFLLDVFCLGVKDAFFAILDNDKYENMKSSYCLTSNTSLEFIHQSCLRKLVEGGVAYAKAIGFNPHPDYKQAVALFGSIDASACAVKYEYGKNNKPFYCSGPNESAVQVQKIINTLTKKVGEGGYDYLIATDDDDF